MSGPPVRPPRTDGTVISARPQKNRDLVWLTVLAAVLFAMLAGLGAWQLKRLAWKQGLIAQIEGRRNTAPVSLETAMEKWKSSRDIEYLRVALEGRFRHPAERHIFAVVGGVAGWRIVTPLETPSGRIVMLDRGFVPNALKQAETRIEGQVSGLQSLTGLARAPGTPGRFSPENDIDKNAWYWRDLNGMAASVLGGEEIPRLVPFFVAAEASDVPGGWPRGGVTRVALPNRHLQYALTWFGLAGALLVVLAVYLWGRLKGRAFT